jgi:sulfite reductase (ferredoxin)
MSENKAALFPAKTYPSDVHDLRLLGLYDMHEEGRNMQRVKISSGRITNVQWRRLAELARDFTPMKHLHVTTRQNIELHGVKSDDIPALHAALDDVGLTTLRAAGDTLRNVTCCPGSGLCSEGRDILPVAESISAACEAIPWLYTLPRKFKISLSSCGNQCAKPWIHDIGLILHGENEFDVIVAGSLGAKPATGIRFPKVLGLDEVVPFVIATIRLFNDEGDREVRTKARLRHVRERMGDEAFLADLTRRFEKEKGVDWPMLPAPFPPEQMPLQARLHLPLGDIRCDDALALADALEAAEATLRVGIEHDLHVYGRKDLALPLELADWQDRPTVIACPGSAMCTRGIADSRVAGQAVTRALDAERSIACYISGCPNNCAHAAIAPLGLIGLRRKIDGESRDCFRVLAGGENGRGPAMGEELHPAIPADRIESVVGRLVDEFKKSAHKGEWQSFVRTESEHLKSVISEMIE